MRADLEAGPSTFNDRTVKRRGRGVRGLFPAALDAAQAVRLIVEPRLVRAVAPAEALESVVSVAVAAVD